MSDVPGIHDAEFDFRARTIEWMEDADRFLPAATCRFDGTAASPTPAGRNVSSVTKNGTGDYTLAFAADVRDGVSVLVGLNGSGAGYVEALSNSDVRVKTMAISSSPALADFSDIFVQVVGTGEL